MISTKAGKTTTILETYILKKPTMTGTHVKNIIRKEMTIEVDRHQLAIGKEITEAQGDIDS